MFKPKLNIQSFLSLVQGLAATIPRGRRLGNLPGRVRQGSLNKICSICGHKNKKCTCEKKDNL